MRWVRAQRARVAAVWLVLNVCALGGAPASACAAAALHASTHADCACCRHGDGRMCPMHRARSSQTAGADTRSCRGTENPLATVAAAPDAVLPRVPSLVVASPAASWSHAATAARLDPSFVPDSPPPRA